MSAAKRGRVQKKLNSATAPSILGFISRREQSPKSIVGSLLSDIVSEVVDKSDTDPRTSGVAVLDYLNKQNRPYSAIDICNNLHKEFGKTAIVKACESLAESGKIKEKVYGKQKVYVADQSQFPEVDDSEIRDMDNKVTELTQKLQTNIEEVKRLESELKMLNSCLTTVEAQKQLTEMTAKCTHYKNKLKQLKEGGNVVSPEEKEKVYGDRKKFVQAWRKRKRMTNDILNAILEGYPKPKKQLYEDIGIETDEDYDVKPPDI